jgi:hypothetical protein
MVANDSLFSSFFIHHGFGYNVLVIFDATFFCTNNWCDSIDNFTDTDLKSVHFFKPYTW